jgi:predicted transposase YdaD
VVGNYNKGKYEGKLEGIKVGKEQGIKVGKEQGIKEGAHQKMIQMAKNCLAEGLGVSLAAKLSGLSEVEIIELITKAE